MEVLAVHVSAQDLTALAGLFAAFSLLFKRAHSFSLANPGYFVFLVSFFLVFLAALMAAHT